MFNRRSHAIFESLLPLAICMFVIMVLNIDREMSLSVNYYYCRRGLPQLPQLVLTLSKCDMIRAQGYHNLLITKDIL